MDDIALTPLKLDQRLNMANQQLGSFDVDQHRANMLASGPFKAAAERQSVWSKNTTLPPAQPFPGQLPGTGMGLLDPGRVMEHLGDSTDPPTMPKNTGHVDSAKFMNTMSKGMK